MVEPRNHGIEIDGRMYTVPSGHLNKVTHASD